MNKLLRLILATALVAIAARGVACWYPTYSPVQYYTSRITVEEPDKKAGMIDLWQRTLLPDVPPQEIAKLIFADGYSLDSIRRLQVWPTLQQRLTAHGGELLHYVCIMRQVNDLRQAMSDPWYYYSTSNPTYTQLSQLADTCLRRLDTRYGDRYAILAARALNTLRRYQELLSLGSSHKFADKELQVLFTPQYAGALYHLGDYRKAAEIFAENGDLPSLTWCLKQLGDNYTELSPIIELARYDSNYDIVAAKLSSVIRSLESPICSSLDFEDIRYSKSGELTALIEAAHVCSAKPGKYQPLWRYAEAMGYLMDRSNFAKADSVIQLIDTRTVDPDFAKSIRTLRFITQSYLKPYDAKYLTWLATEAQWLIEQSDIEREHYTYYDLYDDKYYPADAGLIMFNRDNHCSMLYFSDMLHKAADVVIIPRMLQHADTIAALQMLDIIDYANISTSEIDRFDSHGNASSCYAMERGPEIIIAAIGRSKTPHTPIDHLWLKHGSIRNADRWADLAGTALLAQGRYKEAIPYLASVSAPYAKKRNLAYEGCNHNPFAAELTVNPDCREKQTYISTPPNFKLWFANEMSQLQDIITSHAASPEARAQAELKYGLGMINSVYPCWELTKYGIGESIFSPWTDPNDPYRDIDIGDIMHNFHTDYYFDSLPRANSFARADNRSRHLRRMGRDHITHALAHINDHEIIAAHLRAIGHYRTIKHRYPHTAVARTMQSQCDSWALY